ncbi:permease prefix domain 1-containing protein [Actinomadura roseirufa]|uniref:permease prefix domain 1-containing protein n=1 Tax=Actinomadura roseirufa TaxID=2094049 RepID=UPI0010415172|nr:permease prefix domain 1-containing protein [Actinomadura roseirufa]
MSGADPAGDPIGDYVADLSAALHGPARAKARLIREIHEGLTDAVDAHAAEGLPRHQAARLAIREFGTAADLVPCCQRELTIAQARHTARAAARTVPFLLACWLLLWTAVPDGGWAPRLLTVHLAGVAGTVALLAAATPAVTGALARRLPVPRRLPLAVAWTGTTAGLGMAVAALALITSSPLAADWPPLALAGVLAAVAHGMVATSARACRRCARLKTA